NSSNCVASDLVFFNSNVLGRSRQIPGLWARSCVPLPLLYLPLPSQVRVIATPIGCGLPFSDIGNCGKWCPGLCCFLQLLLAGNSNPQPTATAIASTCGGAGPVSFSAECSKHFHRLYHNTRDCSTPAYYKRCARLLTRLAMSPLCTQP
uniref:ALK and LTK ligand 1 n=1 Tax=Pelodiscus sinensis TaxID=13735 RepID=K7G8X3_PELSI